MSYFNNKHIDRVQECLRSARGKGASGAAIELRHSSSYGCNYAAGRLKHTGLSESLSYNIEVIVNGHRGEASGNVLEAMEQMLERALILAQKGAVSHFAEYPPPSTYKKIKFRSSSVKSLTREKLISDCGELVSALKELDPEMEIEAGGSRRESEGFIAHSGGFLQKTGHTSWSLGAGFTKINGEDMLFAGESRGWGKINHLYDLPFFINKLKRDYQYGIRLANFKAGKMPVLLSPRVSRMFLTPIISGLSGRNVFKGISPLKDKLGQQIFAKNLTIFDNPHIDYAPGSAAFDSVGLPTKPVILIDKGKVQMFLYDYDSAHLAGVDSTAHSGCAPYNVRIMPGACASSDKMLKSIKSGVYIQSLLGFGQSNLDNGDFSCNIAIGYLVENGEIKGRIKNAMMAGNIFSLYNDEIQISSDLEPNSKAPHILFPAINITSK